MKGSLRIRCTDIDCLDEVIGSGAGLLAHATICEVDSGKDPRRGGRTSSSGAMLKVCH